VLCLAVQCWMYNSKRIESNFVSFLIRCRNWSGIHAEEHELIPRPLFYRSGWKLLSSPFFLSLWFWLTVNLWIEGVVSCQRAMTSICT
jgi:hypothetical protein